MSNHLSRFLEEKGNWYLSGGITNISVGYLTDKIMNGLDSMFQKSRALNLVDYIISKNLSVNQISEVIRDLTFCLYFEYVGNTQYKVSQSPISSLLSGVKYKILGKSFLEGCVEPIYQRYRDATKKINLALIYFISKLVVAEVITDDEALELDKIYLHPTHVDYEEMTFNPRFGTLSFIDTLRKFSDVELNQYFFDKYADITGMKNPCKGDNYKSYMRFLRRDNVQEGNRCFYGIEDED